MNVMPYVPVAAGVLLAISLLPTACDEGSEAARVSLPVTTVPLTAAEATVTNDLEYRIEVTGVRAAIKDVLFTVEGEEHLSFWDRLGGLVVGRAHAHPGHAGGGEVTGEVLGNFVVDWSPGAASAELGTATLIAGDYNGADFTYRAADASDGLAAGDALLGRAAVIEGTATPTEGGGSAVAFTLALDPTDSPNVIGAVFDATVTGTTSGSIGLRVVLAEPILGVTLFDGIDFGALDEDADGQLAVESPQAAHNKLMRALHSHDFYQLELTSP